MDLHAPETGDAAPADRDDAARATPMMRQYLEIKAANPDSLLFYRMGDFYELFFADAEDASRALGITLTTRGKHLGADIPMCGVPVHAADDYLQRLIAQGFRVAVCEQLEDPAEAKKRGSKAVVRRDVVRLVTPGTLTEETLLDARRSNYLAAVARVRGGGEALALAWADISTGEFRVAGIAPADLGGALARIAPGETLVSDTLYDDAGLRPVWRDAPGAVTPLPAASFDSAAAERRLTAYFDVATLDGFGGLDRAQVAAAGTLVAYVDRTQRGARPPLAPPRAERDGATMAIDAATRANLEIVAAASGDRRASLLASVDRTVTGAGARELSRRIAAPLTDVGEIAARHDAVAALVDKAELRARLREGLARAPDLARARARLSLDRGGPRDLGAVRDALGVAAELAAQLDALAPTGRLAAVADRLRAADTGLLERLEASLAETLPVHRRDGGFVRTGFSADLDAARALRDESRKVIAERQAAYREATGIRALKVRHNNVLGYFVEVTAQHAARMMAEPLSQTFFHRQTLASQVRFSTAELAELEGRIATAADRAAALEAATFEELRAGVDAAAGGLDAVAGGLAELDVHAGLAETAALCGHVRPGIDDSLAFEVVGGRHPVVEAALAAEAGGPFVANDCDVGPPEGADGGRIVLLTGPNMAGKSTYLRQNALIAVLAQAGAFVPAERAHIGVVDRLFSRVGAADDLARGRSTFMVEMVETAAILNQAGARSLVVLDEIGRGTATFDGLSIAWAAIEHLHEANRCRGLFATHYHELTALAETLPRLVNATMRVSEWQGDVVFLHEVVPGAADRSYGIQVARLAGLPPAVIARAREVLDRLEETDRRAGAAIGDDLPLFAHHLDAARAAAPAPAGPDPLRETLRGVVPDDTTPREALEALYRLKALAGEGPTQ